MFQRAYDTYYFTSQVRTRVLLPRKLLSLLICQESRAAATHSDMDPRGESDY